MATDFTQGLYESWELNETSGNFIGQKSGVEITPSGIIQGQATIIPGGVGSCVFDGANDDGRITPPPNGQKFGTASFAIEVWVKIDNVATGGQETFYTQRTTTALGALLDSTNNPLQPRAYIQDGASNSASLIGTDALANNTLYQFLMVCNRTTQLLHLFQNTTVANTAVDTSAVGSISTTSDYVQWGAAAAAAFFGGGMQRFRIWTGTSAEFTQAQSIELYHGGSGLLYANLAGGSRASRDFTLLGVG